MKKAYCFLFSILLHGSILCAQEINFGLKGGLNYANTIGSSNNDSNRLLSFHAGVFAKIPFSERFSLQSELLFSSQGNSVEVPVENFGFPDEQIGSASNSFKLTSKQNYLNIPVLVKYSLSQLFFLEAGPLVGFHINSVDRAKADNGNKNKETTSGDFRLDYGANLGLGLKLNEELSFYLRYYQGFRNLLSNSQLTDDTSFHSVFQLSAGYIIF